MSRGTTLPNGVKAARLTKRQTLDAREASLRFANKLMTRMALFALGETEDDNGRKIEPMTAQELKAADIVLKKILPDQTSISLPPPDEFESMGREELVEMLAGAVAGNPALLSNPAVREAVNKSQTVVGIREDITVPQSSEGQDADD